MANSIYDLELAFTSFFEFCLLVDFFGSSIYPRAGSPLAACPAAGSGEHPPIFFFFSFLVFFLCWRKVLIYVFSFLCSHARVVWLQLFVLLFLVCCILLCLHSHCWCVHPVALELRTHSHSTCNGGLSSIPAYISGFVNQTIFDIQSNNSLLCSYSILI